MSNYKQIRDKLGYSSDRAFRDAMLAANINPREVERTGLTPAQVKKIPAITRKIEAAAEPSPEPHIPATEEKEGGEPTVAIEQVQAKLGVDPETMVRLCQEFGLSTNRPLAQSEAIALCELAMELYGLQLESDLKFIGDRQALLFQQEQDTAFQLGYLQASAIDNAHQQGRLEARSKQLGKQEEAVRSSQNQVFSLLSQAGRKLKRQGKSAAEAHQSFCQKLWA